MMRPRVVLPFVLAFTSSSLAACAGAQQPSIVVRPLYDRPDDRVGAGRYSDRDLDNLVGPVALYPDALLAQVLVAATLPDQIESAARYVRARGTGDIDYQSWDVSVKSVAHYPTVLQSMADRLDWTAALGRAYAAQSYDVMASVQHMRRLAHDQGNLVSTEQQSVIIDNGNYIIVPAQSRVIYVPVYDPIVIYSRPVFYVRGGSRYFSWGLGFPIGGWLSYDVDWRGRRVDYDGWNDRGYGYDWWRVRSRPYVQVTNVYINGGRDRDRDRDDWNRGGDRDHGRDRATPPRGRNDGFDYRTAIPPTVTPRVGDGNNGNGNGNGKGNGSTDGRDRGQGRDNQPRDAQPRDRRSRPQPEDIQHEQQPRQQTVQQPKAPEQKPQGPRPEEKRPESREKGRNDDRGQFVKP